MANIQNLYRYPIKGLSAEPMNSVQLHAGAGFPLDRKFALTNGSWTFEGEHYEPRPKTDFLALVKYERMAQLKCQYHHDNSMVSVADPTGAVNTYVLTDEDSRAALARFVGFFIGRDSLDGDPALVQTEGISFTDISVKSKAMMNSISLINLTSVEALGDALGARLNPLRFRANLYYRGHRPWEELDWLGREIKIGNATVKVNMRTRRCAATNVDPETGHRDLGIPQALLKNYRHGDLGIYAEVTSGEEISLGDELQLLD
jgi:uncharacterized protein YcbX